MTPPNPTQPRPLLTIISVVTIQGNPATAVYRRWKPEEFAACKLCNRCTTNRPECVVVVPGHLNMAESQGLRAVVTKDGWRRDRTLSLDPARVAAARAKKDLAHHQADPPSGESSLDWFRRMMGVG